jgi:hypothetical protein
MCVYLFEQKEVCFYITPSDPAITRSQHQDSIGYSDIRPREAWPEILLSDIAVGK